MDLNFLYEDIEDIQIHSFPEFDFLKFDQLHQWNMNKIDSQREILPEFALK